MDKLIKNAILLTLLITMAAAVPAQETALANKVLDTPAASPLGIMKGRTPAQFAEPQLGPATECGNIRRQFAVMNPVIVRGEPLIVRMLLEVIDPDDKAEFQAQLNFGADLKAVIYPPEGQPYEFLGRQLGTNIPTSVVQMNDFERFRMDVRLAMDSETISGSAFDIEGEYRIRFILMCSEEKELPRPQEMGVFNVKVLPAEGDDAKALEILDDYTIFEALQANTAVYGRRELLSEENVRQLSRLVSEAPKAALRPYAMMLLADYYRKNEKKPFVVSTPEGVQEEITLKGTEGAEHFANFLDAIRSGKDEDLNANISDGHYAAALSHMGNISHRLGRGMQFDDAQEKFINDPEANAMLTRKKYRKPYVVPDNV